MNMQEALAIVFESKLAQVHTSLPGIVKSYNSSTCTANVQPAVKRLVATDEPGIFDEETLPEIPDVPVAWPGGGGNYFHVALVPGDSVLLVFSSLDPSTWHRTGEIAPPADHREHSVAHAFAIPCVYPLNGVAPALGLKVPTAEVGVVAFSHQVATADKVFAYVTQLIAQLNTAGAIPLTGTLLSGYITAALTAALTTPGLPGAGSSNFGTSKIVVG